jgi:hypothetical protein
LDDEEQSGCLAAARSDASPRRRERRRPAAHAPGRTRSAARRGAARRWPEPDDPFVAKGIVRPELADRADAVDLERQSAMERATRSGESERDDYVGLATLPLFPPFVAVRLAA